jgi:choline dehydrogenase-like flavoprotein
LSQTKTDKYGYPLAEINWKVSSKDSQSVEKFYNILKNDGFSDSDFEFTHKFEDLEWDKNFTSAAHHVGTCRMAIDKSEGVVDENLKVFGTNNLYICDGSVFPTGGNVNNGFTIAALASRLSNHLLIKNKNG